LSRFNKTTGRVVFDKAAKTGSVDIVIDAKSADAGYATLILGTNKRRQLSPWPKFNAQDWSVLDPRRKKW
jgi:hypothetical protein